MGWVKDAKASAVGKDAAEAWESGASFFTPVLNMPAGRLGFSGGVADWPPMLESVAAVGWRLHTWAVGVDEKGHPQAMPLFTR